MVPIGIAVGLLVVAVARPTVLAPLNKLWTRFGLMLHRITSPIVLGVIFFGVLLPTGMLMRLFGRRPLRVTPDPRAETYWVPRAEQPSSDHLKRQF